MAALTRIYFVNVIRTRALKAGRGRPPDVHDRRPNQGLFKRKLSPSVSAKTRGALPSRLCPPGEKAVVLQPGLAVAERRAREAENMAAGGFEHRLAGGGVPFHRRAETRVEIGLAGGEHAEFEGAAAFAALDDRTALEILGEAAAVLVAAAVHDEDPPRRQRPRPDRLESAAVAPPHRGAGAVRGVGQPDRRAVHHAEH